MPEYSKWVSIAKYPVTIDKVHESVYRSYHALEEVKKLLSIKTPQEVILEAIRVMEQTPIETEWTVGVQK